MSGWVGGWVDERVSEWVGRFVGGGVSDVNNTNESLKNKSYSSRNHYLTHKAMTRKVNNAHAIIIAALVVVDDIALCGQWILVVHPYGGARHAPLSTFWHES
jgi:hypothetical protein